MEIYLPYGSGKLAVSLGEDWEVSVIEAPFAPALEHPMAAVEEALRMPVAGLPLAEFARGAGRVGIVINDVTRATPTPLLLRAILQSLPDLPEKAVTLFNATGTHRANTSAELEAMLGVELANRFPIMQNDARNEDTQTCLGHTRRGHPIWLNRQMIECDRLILTGFIEPHFFAGFSAGGKAIFPGMGGLRSVLANHGPNMIADPRATWGITQGNPIWDEIMEVAGLVKNTFLLNVVMNREKAIMGIFAGSLAQAHAAGCAFARETCMAPVDGLFDIVLTSNSGYPLDQNLYQAVKGMSAAARIVRPGGAMVIAAECRDGVPEGSGYQAILREAGSPERLLEMFQVWGEVRPDQWQAQIQAQIQARAEVYVASSLPDKTVAEALFQPVRCIEESLAALVRRYGPTARIAVLTEGPQTIPYVRKSI